MPWSLAVVRPTHAQRPEPRNRRSDRRADVRYMPGAAPVQAMARLASAVSAASWRGRRPAATAAERLAIDRSQPWQAAEALASNASKHLEHCHAAADNLPANSTDTQYGNEIMNRETLRYKADEIRDVANKAYEDVTAGRITEAKFDQIMTQCEHDNERHRTMFKSRQRAVLLCDTMFHPTSPCLAQRLPVS
jgi:hypothetical protein